MQYLKLALILFLIPQSHVLGQGCDCVKSLDSLVKSIHSDYSGFNDKVTHQNQIEYFKLLDSLRIEAVKYKDFNCYLLLRRYLSFFNDPHLNLVFYTNTPEKKNRINELFLSWPLMSLKSRRYNAAKKNDTLTGCWFDMENNLEMKVVKMGRRYHGIISKGDSIFWNKGMVKFTIENNNLDYYDYYHIKRNVPFRFTKDVLKFGRSEVWVKGKDKLNKDSSYEGAGDFSYVNINDSVGLFTINSFHNFFKDSIDHLIASSLQSIDRVMYLIFDLRNNGGGHSSEYYKFLKLFFNINTTTNTEYYRVSPNNILNLTSLLNSKSYTDSAKKTIRLIVDTMNLHLGKKDFVSVFKPEKISFNTNYTKIKRIGIVISKVTSSAAEYFVNYAKNDIRTTVYGQESRGAMNYTDIGRLRVLPCDILAFYCPMAKQDGLNSKSIFNLGIQPDFIIDVNNTRWLDQIVNDIVKF